MEKNRLSKTLPAALNSQMTKEVLAKIIANKKKIIIENEDKKSI